MTYESPCKAERIVVQFVKRPPPLPAGAIPEYIQQWYMSYRFADSLRAGSGQFRKLSANLCDIYLPLLCVQWKTPGDGQRNFRNM